jgi:hypothetical protein
MLRRLTLACLFYLWIWDGITMTIYRIQGTTTIGGPQWTYVKSYDTEAACLVGIGDRNRFAKCLPASLDPTQY